MRTTLFLVCLSLSTAAALAAQSTQSAAPPGPHLGPLTITPGILACTDVPTTAAPASELVVLGRHSGDPRENAVPGDVVVLKGGTPQGFAIGQQYYARRLRKPTNHEPVTVGNPGAVMTSGWLTVVAADTQFALARIDRACVAVEPGDYLERFVEPVLPTTLAARGRTDFNDLGRVLFGIWRREVFGAGDVLSIDRGSAKGITSGTRLAFYRDLRNGRPLVEIGEGIVLEVSAESARVVVERAAGAIIRGDLYGVSGKP